MDDFETHPTGTGAKLTQLQADLARERDRVANALRLLDDYRERGAPMPTYAQLIGALQG